MVLLASLATLLFFFPRQYCPLFAEEEEATVRFIYKQSELRSRTASAPYRWFVKLASERFLLGNARGFIVTRRSPLAAYSGLTTRESSLEVET